MYPAQASEASCPLRVAAAFDVQDGMLSPIICEVAGKDSVLAMDAIVAEGKYRTLVQTIAYSGTERGDLQAFEKNAQMMKARYSDVPVSDAAIIYCPELWSALNGRFVSFVVSRYGQYSPCLACHLYFHLCRVPLAKRIGALVNPDGIAAPILSGDKDHHHGVIKPSQPPASIDAFADVLAHAGVKFYAPKRVQGHLDTSKIAADVHDVKCFFSANFKSSAGLMDDFDLAAHQRYVDEFLRPAGFAIIDAWEAIGYDPEVRPDYFAIVQSIVDGIIASD